VREVARHLANAPNAALIAGVAVNLLGVGDLPELIARPFEILGAATLPLTMLYAGIMIEVRGLGRLWPEMTYAVVVRLGVSALLGVAIASLLRFSGDVFNTIVIMAAMPTAMMSLVIGARSGLRSDVLAGAVVVTTVLATITLPLWRAVLL
jgi:predicted permease